MPVLATAVLFASVRSALVLAVLAITVVLGLRTRRLPLAAAIVVVGIGVAFARLQFYGSVASQAAAASGNPLIARQVSGLVNPLDPRQSTLLLHVDLVVAGLRSGVTSRWAPARVRRTSPWRGSAVTTTVGSTEIDVSNAFVSLGLLGGLTFLGILVLGFTAVVRRYLAGEALALPVLALLVVCLGQWLDGRPLCPDALLWFPLGWAQRAAEAGDRDVNILIVNHTAIMSGAEATTLELLRERQRDVRYLWASPAGPLADAARALGAEHIPLRGTTGSLRLDPRDTPIAVAELGQMGLVLRRATARHRVHLVHAVSMRAGIVAAICRRLGGPPFVVYQHDVAPPGRVGQAIRALVDPAAGRLIGCSDHILQSLRREGYRTPGEVLFEPVDVEAFASANRIRGRDPRGVGAGSGTGDCRDCPDHALEGPGHRDPGPGRSAPDAPSCAPGHGRRHQVRRPRHALRQSRLPGRPRELIAELGLEDAVHLRRPAAEHPRAHARRRHPPAALLGGAVRARRGRGHGRRASRDRNVGGWTRADDHGWARRPARRRPRNPQAWAAAINRLLDDPALARRIGENARAAAERFSVARFYPAIRAAHLAAL